MNDTSSAMPEEPAGADPEINDPDEEATQEDQENSSVGEEETSPEPEAAESEDSFLKLIISIRNGRTMVGVQRNSADPYMETTPATEIEDIAEALPGVVQRAIQKWETNLKNPAYHRPTPPAKTKSRPATARTNRETQQAAPEVISAPALF